jgi:integrase
MAKRARVIELPVTGAVERPQPLPEEDKPRRVVEASQEAINRLPRDGAEYSVQGIPGLLVWRGKAKTSFRLVRRTGGRLKKVTLEASTLSAARREAARVWNQLKPSAESRIPRFGDAFEAYLEARRLAPATVAVYKRTARTHLLPQFGSKRMDSFDRAALHAHLVRIEREHGRGMAALVSKIFRAVYCWSGRLYNLPDDPLRSYETPRLAARNWSFTPEELVRWWQEVKEKPPVHRTFLLCALLSGARCSSVLNLKWSDLDFGNGVMTFKVAKGRPYSVPMSDRLRRILEEYRRSAWPANEADLLFPSLTAPGKPRTSLRLTNPFRGMHALRHTARSYLARLGAPLEVAMALLGHAFTGSVSLGYVSRGVLIEPAREYANKLAEEFARICGFDDAE